MARVKHLRLKVSMIVVVAAIPWLVAAARCWIRESERGYLGEGYLAGDGIYRLGAPLTLLMNCYVKWRQAYLGDADLWWAITVLSVLFIIQWIIWAQLGISVVRRMRNRRRNG